MRLTRIANIMTPRAKQIQFLLKAGATTLDIKNATGCNDSAVSVERRKLGIRAPVGRKRGIPNKITLQRVIKVKLYRDDLRWSFSKIGKAMGMTRAGANWLYHYGPIAISKDTPP